MPPQLLRFPRRRRLTQPRQFHQLKTAGRRLAQGTLVLNWQSTASHASSRLGVITSRKIGNAVARNRARRLMRESFRKHQHDLRQHIDLVLVARPSIAGKSFAEVETDFLAGLRRAGLLQEPS